MDRASQFKPEGDLRFTPEPPWHPSATSVCSTALRLGVQVLLTLCVAEFVQDQLTALPSPDDLRKDLTGKTVVVIGGNSGLGLEGIMFNRVVFA